MFANTFYLYTISLMPVALSTSLKLVLYERGEIRVRMALMLVAAISLTLLTVLKIGTTIIGYYRLTAVPASLFPLINLLLLISSVTWPAMFLPSRYYRFVLTALDFVRNLKNLLFLTYLRRRVSHFYPIVVEPAPWGTQLRQPLLHIYQAIISIQEVKTVRLQANQPTEPDGPVLAMLRETDDGALLDERLVAAYVTISQKLLLRDLRERVRRMTPGRNHKGGD